MLEATIFGKPLLDGGTIGVERLCVLVLYKLPALGD
jgi:hypothetical protein